MHSKSNPIYVTATHIREKHDISTATLVRWANANKVRVIRGPGLQGGRRLYHEQDVAAMLGNTGEETIQKKTILYARVSSHHQSEDLERQLEDLKQSYRERYEDGDDAEIIKDIGSGLNWKRSGLMSLLDRIHDKGDIGQIVVTYRDRLARIGVELLEWFFKKHSIEFLVLYKTDDDPNCPNNINELRDDLLAITTFFVAKNNGLRAAANRKQRKTRETQEKTKEEVKEM